MAGDDFEAHRWRFGHRARLAHWGQVRLENWRLQAQARADYLDRCRHEGREPNWHDLTDDERAAALAPPDPSDY